MIIAVVKQLKQLQRKARKNSEASMGFELLIFFGGAFFTNISLEK